MPSDGDGNRRVRSRHAENGALGAHSEQAVRPAREGPASQGRTPSDKPDVYLRVPEIHVGEIYLDVEDLDAHLSLQAKLANLVQLTAGVHVHIGKVELDIKDVDAQAVLKVRLEKLYDILDRALTTVDRNPEILQGLLNTVGTAVDSVGETAQQALQPGGAVSRVADEVGEVGKEALGPGGAATEAVGSVGGTAQEAVRPGGAVSEAADAAGQAVNGIGGAVSGTAESVGEGVSDSVRSTARQTGDAAQKVPRQAHDDPRGRLSHRRPARPAASGRGRRQEPGSGDERADAER